LVRILVADDSPAIRRCLRGLLDHHADWRVCDEACNGKEAVERFQDAKPDLIVIDFQMPEMNGLDASRRISEKQGMRIVALEDREYVSGKFLSEIWEITAEEWNSKR